MTRVVIVDDQELVRAGVRRILRTDGDIDVVGECTDGDEVPGVVGHTKPDVVLMDVRMKRVDGATATQRLVAAGGPPVVVLTTFDDDEVLAAALRAGAAGFLLKDAPGEDLIRAVKTVGDGGSWLDPSVTGRVLDAYRSGGGPAQPPSKLVDQLTAREREVLVLMARGASNTEIAEQLYVGEVTVKTHVGRIFTKLGVRDRAAAIVFAYDNGLVTPRGAGPR